MGAKQEGRRNTLTDQGHKPQHKWCRTDRHVHVRAYALCYTASHTVIHACINKQTLRTYSVVVCSGTLHSQSRQCVPQSCLISVPGASQATPEFSPRRSASVFFFSRVHGAQVRGLASLTANKVFQATGRSPRWILATVCRTQSPSTLRGARQASSWRRLLISFESDSSRSYRVSDAGPQRARRSSNISAETGLSAMSKTLAVAALSLFAFGCPTGLPQPLAVSRRPGPLPSLAELAWSMTDSGWAQPRGCPRVSWRVREAHGPQNRFRFGRQVHPRQLNSQSPACCPSCHVSRARLGVPLLTGHAAQGADPATVTVRRTLMAQKFVRD